MNFSGNIPIFEKDLANIIRGYTKLAPAYVGYNKFAKADLVCEPVT
jgi:hypothetical protein